jgi:hypothetical protein
MSCKYLSNIIGDGTVSGIPAADDFPKQILPVASLAAINGFLYPRQVCR